MTASKCFSCCHDSKQAWLTSDVYHAHTLWLTFSVMIFFQHLSHTRDFCPCKGQIILTLSRYSGLSVLMFLSNRRIQQLHYDFIYWRTFICFWEQLSVLHNKIAYTMADYPLNTRETQIYHFTYTNFAKWLVCPKVNMMSVISKMRLI